MFDQDVIPLCLIIKSKNLASLLSQGKDFSKYCAATQKTRLY